MNRPKATDRTLGFSFWINATREELRAYAERLIAKPTEVPADFPITKITPQMAAESPAVVEFDFWGHAQRRLMQRETRRRYEREEDARD